MATYGEGLNTGRRGQAMFIVFTRQHWRGFLFGGLLLTLVLLLTWQNVRDAGFDAGGGRTADPSPEPEAVAVMGSVVAPINTGVLLADGNVEYTGAEETGMRAAEDGVSVATPPSSSPQLSDVYATNIPPPRVHPFDKLQLERDRTRSRQTEALQQTMNDPTSPTEAREAARSHLQQLWNQALREAEVEQLLAIQGYTAVVVLSENGVHVVVDAVLDMSSATRVGELVGRVTGVDRQQISIVDSLSSGG